jgi:hypothetical protein
VQSVIHATNLEPRRRVRTQRRWRLAALMAVALAMLAPASAQAAPAGHAQRLDHSRLGTRPVLIHDRIVRSRAGTRRALRATASAYDSTYPIASGESVRIIMSDGFVPDRAVAQSWADFLGGLIHGDELTTVTVYVATDDEVLDGCGPQVLACYVPSRRLLVVPGHPPQDGTPLEEIAAHEYGHHIARERKNTPWPAIDWGPKRWASYEGICPREDAGEVFPGDEGEHYTLNPGEAFADSYRIANGGSPSLWRFDRSFYPDATDVARIRADVLDPWDGQTVYSYSGRIGRRGSRSRIYTVHVHLDGNMNFRLAGPPHSDFDLFLYLPGRSRAIGSSTGNGRYERLLGKNCGGTRFWVQVFRVRGGGRFRLTISKP